MFTSTVYLHDVINKERGWAVFICLIFSAFIFFIPIHVYAEEIVRSTSLHIVKTEEENVERTDYVNEEGVITDAADKHYATIIKTKNSNTVLEEYFHADGTPAIQGAGNYALLREYNEKGQNYQITYLGIDGEPILNTSGYSIQTRTYDDEGRIETEMYYDTKEKPIETLNYAYGCFKEYNELGRNICTTYVDQNYKSAICGQGFSIIRRNYYETEELAGKIKEEFYYDQNDIPISLSLGQYGVYHEYDDFGRVITLTYLDADGYPIVTKEGYSTIKRTYYEDDSVETVRYFDSDGKPMRLSEGQYGYRIENGETIYIDSTGNDLFNLKNYLYDHQSSVIIICLLLILASVICNRRFNLLLLILYVVFILYMTLFYRESGTSIYKLDLFWSYRQFFHNSQLRQEIINNILLFIPLGAILYKIYQKPRVIFAAVLLSIVIEITQLVSATGWFELDDIFSNGLGGLFGYMFEYVILKIKNVISNYAARERNFS